MTCVFVVVSLALLNYACLASSHLNRTRRRAHGVGMDLPGACYDKTAAYGEGSCPWWLPDTYIPYYISGSYNAEQTQTIRQAMSVYNRETCLVFTETASVYYSGNGIAFKNLDGCWSTIGKRYYSDGLQDISLGIPGCVGVGTVLHEVGHALGWWHEQSRSDRQAYVYDLKENILDGQDSQFWIHDSYTKIPYDFDSIMHYSNTAFTFNGRETLKHVDRDYAGMPFSNVETLSHYDKKWVNWMYQCGAHCSGSCEHEGFKDKHCACVCPQYLAGPTCQRVSTGCGDVYRMSLGESVEITSPNYPAAYPATRTCAYVITSPRSSKLLVKFDDLDLQASDQCQSDYLEVRTMGIPIKGPRYCGTQTGKVSSSVHNHMMLVFHSDDNIQKRGFKVTVSAVTQTDCDSRPCQHGGVCKTAQYGRYYCECPAGWYGADCGQAEGGFTEWSEWTACPTWSQCAKRVRRRSCSNPPPADPSRDCGGHHTDVTDCGDWSCAGSYSCDFNNEYMCGAQNDHYDDGIDWTIHSSWATNGYYGGARGDASYRGGKYYLEVASRQGYHDTTTKKGSKARLYLPTVHDNQLRCLRFMYYTFRKSGPDGGSMVVAAFYSWADGERGQQYWHTARLTNRDEWVPAAIEITNVFAPYRVAIEAVIGEVGESDVGLDNVSLSIGGCLEQEITVPEATKAPPSTAAPVTAPPATTAPPVKPPGGSCEKVESALHGGLQQLNLPAGAWANVFTSLSLHTDGRLVTLRYFAARSGTFYLDIWRSLGGSDMKLIGINKVYSPGAGLQEHNVPESEQIHVRAGDVVGVHYPRAAEAEDAGVLYYEDSRHPRTSGVPDSDLHPFLSLGMFDDIVKVGINMDVEPIGGIRRGVAMEMTIHKEDGDCEPVKPPVGSCQKVESALMHGLRELNLESGTWGNVFTTFSLQTSGQLVKWRYYAVRSGTFYVDIWRSLGGSDMKLVGKNKIVSPSAGLQEHSVPASEQISVRPGDMVGVHYPRAAEAGNQGVLYYEDSRHPRTSGVPDSDLYSFFAAGMFDDVLKVGISTTNDALPGMKRGVAIEVTIMADTGCEQSTGCKVDNLGATYSGTASTTKDGLTCQRWDQQTPHSHTRTDVNNFPDGSLAEAGNYCRNPDREPQGPWCYTTDPAVRWQYCDIPLCGESSKTDTCADSHESCARWMKEGECTANPEWMLPHCRRSCGQCAETCWDSRPANCPGWAEAGECDTNPTWMRENCQKSCKMCETRCYDDDDSCGEYAEKGDCETNAQWMLAHCPAACRICTALLHIAPLSDHTPRCADHDTACADWALKGECVQNPTFMKVKCPASCGQCGCADVDDLCSMWASEGECLNNPEYMKIKCRKSCGLCCEDQLDQSDCCLDRDPRCPDWANQNLCDRSDSPISTQECFKSCHKCHS